MFGHTCCDTIPAAQHKLLFANYNENSMSRYRNFSLGLGGFPVLLLFFAHYSNMRGMLVS